MTHHLEVRGDASRLIRPRSSNSVALMVRHPEVRRDRRTRRVSSFASGKDHQQRYQHVRIKTDGQSFALFNSVTLASRKGSWRIIQGCSATQTISTNLFFCFGKGPPTGVPVSAKKSRRFITCLDPPDPPCSSKLRVLWISQLPRS